MFGNTTAFFVVVFVKAMNTLLLYSITALPSLLIVRAQRISLLWRSSGALALLIIPAAIAILPGVISNRQAQAFKDELTRDDYWHQAIERPRRISIVTNDTDDQLSCNLACRSLLFGHDVESVRMIKASYAHPGNALFNDALFNEEHSTTTTYAIATAPSCPPASPAARPHAGVRQQIATEQCLVNTPNDETPVDTSIVLKVFRQDHGHGLSPNITIPWFVTLDTIGVLSIEQRRQYGTAEPIVRKTFAVLGTIPIPLVLNFAPALPGVARRPAIALHMLLVNQAQFANVHEIIRSFVGFRG